VISDYTSRNNGDAQHNNMKHTRTIQGILMTLVTYIKQFYNNQAPDTPPITKTW